MSSKAWQREDPAPGPPGPAAAVRTFLPVGPQAQQRVGPEAARAGHSTHLVPATRSQELRGLRAVTRLRGHQASVPAGSTGPVASERSSPESVVALPPPDASRGAQAK